MIYRTIWISVYSINTFENLLKWVVYISTMWSPCIDCIGKKSCSKFLRNLVTTMYFTDRNWNSKTVYLLFSIFSNLIDLDNWCGYWKLCSFSVYLRIVLGWSSATLQNNELYYKYLHHIFILDIHQNVWF